MDHKKYSKFFIPIALIIFIGFSLSFKDVFINEYKSNTYVKDIEGNLYKTIKIGDQEWMLENLKVTKYRNGDPIPFVKEDAEWGNQNSGARCYYNNKVNNSEIYGNLYNWYAVTDERNIAPEGWHVPTVEDWNKLIEYLGGFEKAGGKLKNISLWDYPNAEATNSSGFSALPGGIRYASGKYYNIKSGAYWWSPNISDDEKGIAFHVYYFFGSIYEYKLIKELGISVRCVKD